jgi:predicted CopG family antitoxin
MKEITIQVADNVYKELLTSMKFKKMLGSIHGIEDEFVLLILYAVESKKPKLVIEEKQKNETIKISDDLKEIMTEVKKGRKRGNCK